VIFVHLFNDRSGSPRVLASVIEVMGDPERDLLCVAKGDGILETVAIPRSHYRYKRRNSRFLTLFDFLMSQWDLFLLLCRQRRQRPKGEAIYINTAYPFAAGLFGWLCKREVIYHLHEISITPPLMRRFLWGVVRLTATEIRFVSEHQAQATGLFDKKTRVIYNTVSSDLAGDVAQTFQKENDGSFRVLMLSTLRDYKGIPEYMDLARHFEPHDDYIFQLVTNDDTDVVERYLSSRPPLPSNVQVISRTSELAPLYRQADVVLNLSRPSEWVETFGLTLLEAMSFGVPVIAPPAGGPIELLGETLSDYLIMGNDLDSLVAAISDLKSGDETYARVSSMCRDRAEHFNWQLFADAIKTCD